MNAFLYCPGVKYKCFVITERNRWGALVNTFRRGWGGDIEASIFLWLREGRTPMCFPCTPQAAAPIPTSGEPLQLSVYPSSPGSHSPLVRKGKAGGQKLFYFRDAGQEGLPRCREFGPPARPPYVAGALMGPS